MPRVRHQRHCAKYLTLIDFANTRWPFLGTEQKSQGHVRRDRSLDHRKLLRQ